MTTDDIILIIVIIIIAVIITDILLIIRFSNLKFKKNYEERANNEKEKRTIFENQQYKRYQTYYPYHKKYLLTKNEYYFYKKLKEITEPLNLQILAKIRLADLIEVNKGLDSRKWGMYFGKIKAKHIDFAIAEDMKIIALIELDDYTHKREDRQERDIFVNDVLAQTGYTLIRTYGDIQQIKQFLESRENYINIDKEYEKV